MAPAPRSWREVERRPVPGNSPNDRILRGPDCNRPRRVCADPFPAAPWPRFRKTQRISGMRFLRQAESIWSDVVSKSKPSKPGAGYRLPLVGPGPSLRTRREELRALLIVRR